MHAVTTLSTGTERHRAAGCRAARDACLRRAGAALLDVLGEPEFFIAARLGNAELLVRELPSLEKR